MPRSTSPVVTALAFVLAIYPASATALDLKPIALTYLLRPRMPLPAGAKAFSVQGAEDLGLQDGAIEIGGLQRAPSGGDVVVKLSGAAPQAGQATLASFVTRTSILVPNDKQPDENGKIYFAKEKPRTVCTVTTHWATVPISMHARLVVAAGGAERSYDVGGKTTVEVGPKPDTSSGVLQTSFKPTTLMESEPHPSVEAAKDRARWIAQNFCTDVRGALETKEGNGQACVRAKLAEATSPASMGKVRQKVLERINSTLERELGSGERTLRVNFSIEDDKRFDPALATLQGKDPDRYRTAAAALQPIADDGSAKPRARAAALYDLAVCQVGAREFAAAQESLAKSREMNAKEGDGWFGSSQKDLGKQIDTFEPLLRELVSREKNAPDAASKAPAEPDTGQAAPAAGASPASSKPPPPVRAVPAAAAQPPASNPFGGVPGMASGAMPAAGTVAPAAAGKPWTELSDDEFMAAYPNLIKDALSRRDTAEMQQLGKHMAEVSKARRN